MKLKLLKKHKKGEKEAAQFWSAESLIASATELINQFYFVKGNTYLDLK
jgi:hypothetical protein